jgi:hypothetical protein
MFEMSTNTSNDNLFVLKFVERIEALKLKRRVLEWEAEGRLRNGRPNKDGWRETENE